MVLGLGGRIYKPRRGAAGTDWPEAALLALGNSLSGPPLISSPPSAQTYRGFDNISLTQFLAVVTGLVLTSAVVAVAMILPALLVRGDRAVIKQIEEEEEVKQTKMVGVGMSGVERSARGRGLTSL